MLTSDYLLATSIEAFDTWRAGKSHPSSPTPQPLRQQALALIEHAEHKPNTFITLPVEQPPQTPKTLYIMRCSA
jgi:hypothetical protein